MIYLEDNNLWLGNVRDIRNLKGVLDANIQAIVDLAVNEPIPQLVRDLVYCRFPIFDGPDNPSEMLQLAIRTVADLISKNIGTLVYCSNGVSRTPVIVAAALSLARGSSLEENLEKISDRLATDVTPGLWSDVKVAYDDAQKWDRRT